MGRAPAPAPGSATTEPAAPKAPAPGSERDARYADARGRWERGERDTARDDFEAPARDFPDDDEIAFALAVVRLHLGDHARAAELFERHLQRHPDSGAARDYLAWIRSRQPKPPAAYEPTLPGPLVLGRVEHVELRSEVDQNRALTAYSPNIGKQNVSTLTIRMRRADDGRLVAVELRGRMLTGSPPLVGERIAVPERWRDGALHVTRLQNLETGAIVSAAEPSVAAKGLFAGAVVARVVFALVVIAFIAIVWSQLVPTLLRGH